MPFTPYHFGPGALVKVLLWRRFSFPVFVLVQVLIDLEPLFLVFSGEPPYHRFFHTYAGATFLLVVGAVLGKRGLERFARADLSWACAFASAAIGAWSHVFLDSFLYRDMRPLFPFDPSNPLAHRMSTGSMHLFCVLSGLAGLAVFVLRLRAGRDIVRKS